MKPMTLQQNNDRNNLYYETLQISTTFFVESCRAWELGSELSGSTEELSFPLNDTFLYYLKGRVI